MRVTRKEHYRAVFYLGQDKTVCSSIMPHYNAPRNYFVKRAIKQKVFVEQDNSMAHPQQHSMTCRKQMVDRCNALNGLTVSHLLKHVLFNTICHVQT